MTEMLPSDLMSPQEGNNMCKRKTVLCADGVLINDGKILLLKRNVEPFKDHWHLVGGHVEDDETLQTALKREYKEETNLDINVGKLIDSRIENTRDRTKMIAVLEVVSAVGQIKLNHENSAFGWFAETPVDSVCSYDSYLNYAKQLINRHWSWRNGFFQFQSR